MTDFIAHILETARIQSNSLKMFPLEVNMPNPCANQFQQEQEELMRAWERDRDSAQSTVEPCHLCAKPAEEECDFCHKVYCEPHLASHDCTGQQIFDGVINREILRRLGNE